MLLEKMVYGPFFVLVIEKVVAGMSILALMSLTSPRM